MGPHSLLHLAHDPKKLGNSRRRAAQAHDVGRQPMAAMRHHCAAAVGAGLKRRAVLDEAGRIVVAAGRTDHRYGNLEPREGVGRKKAAHEARPSPGRKRPVRGHKARRKEDAKNADGGYIGQQRQVVSCCTAAPTLQRSRSGLSRPRAG